MDVRLPDGTVVQNVPDDISKAQLVDKLKANGMEVPKEWLSKQEEKPKLGGSSFIDQIKRQLMLTARAGVTGATAIPGMLADVPANLQNIVAGTYNKATGSNVPGWRRPSDEQQKLMTRMGLPEPETPMERIAQIVASSMVGAGGQAGVARALRPVSPMAQQVANQFSQAPGAQVLSAATAGGAAGVAGEMGAGPVGQMVAAVAGGMLPSALRAIPRPMANQELGALSKEHDVPLTAGEQSRNIHLQKTETATDAIPIVGTKGFREVQQQKARAAASRAVESFKGNTEDVGKGIQDSLRRVLKSNKETATKLYDKVAEEVSKPGVTNEVQPTNVQQAASDLLKTYPDIFDRLPSVPVKNKLTAIVKGIGENSEQPAVLLPDGSKQLAKTLPLTFDEARFLRKQLGNYIDRAQKSAGAVGNDELRQLTLVKSDLDHDIENFGQGLNGKALKAFKEANSFYKNSVAPFRDTLINKATGKDVDTDTIFKMFVKPDRPKLAQKLSARMDEPGQQAVKYGVLKNAFDTAMDERTGMFSPQKFSTAIDRLGDTNGVVFSPDEKTQLFGLNKLMTAAQRAGQYMENPPTGNRLIHSGGMVGLGAALITHPIATLFSAGGVKALSWLLTNEAGKKILTQAAKAPEDSQRLNQLMLHASMLAARNAQTVNKNRQ